MSIPDSTIEEIRARVSIVDIASEFCDVKRSGSKHVACCPFHQEKTPSCSFNEEEGFFFCFGCGKKGNVYTLLMELRGMSFPDAVRALGERSGVAVPEENSRGNRGSGSAAKESVILREVVAAAARAFIYSLRDVDTGREGREYFQQRGLSDAIQKRYCLGYAPDSWEFLEKKTKEILETQDFSGHLEQLPKYLSAIGLIKQRSSDSDKSTRRSESSYFDVFRDRVVFPILRNDNTPIAFGARLLKGDGKSSPKYLNTCESILYQKRKVLYGLGPALSDIRNLRHLYLVEGYMDVLSLVDAGVPNVLATCGTSVTEDHARAISRFADRVTLVFDGDQAGLKAAARCFEAFLNTGVDVTVRTLPEGEDPDTIARDSVREGRSAESIVNYLKDKQSSLLQIYVAQVREELVGTEESVSAALLGKVAERTAVALSKVRNPVERELYTTDAAKYLGISQSSLANVIDNQQRHAQELSKFTSNSKKVNKRSFNKFNSPQASSNYNSSSSSMNSSSSEEMPPIDSYSGTEGEDFAESSQDEASKAPRSIERFHHELIVAVLREPLLAPTVLEIPSLLQSEDAAGTVDTPSPSLPLNLLAFIEHIAESGLPLRIPEDCQGVEGRNLVASFLEEHSIRADEILDDLFRQYDVGGGKPELVVSQAAKIARRQGLLKEMLEIRGQEERNPRTDEGESLRLAQQKLEKRKALERVSAEDKD